MRAARAQREPWEVISMRGKPAGLAAILAACALADALVIGSFPLTVEGTTVGATVERLDPQKSQCGTVESTVWYRVDKAPDGTISMSVKGAGLAPVVRVYNVTKN